MTCTPNLVVNFIVVISFHIVLFFISGALKSASTVSLVQCVLKG